MGISTKLPISHLLIIIDQQTLYQIILRHSTFNALIRYANHFMIIFLNINLYIENERKMVIKLKGIPKNYSYRSC